MAQEEKRLSLLEELKRSSGYDIALMTTFNFEIEFFERIVLNTLFANDIRKVSVFVDSKELSKALQHIEISSIGRKYMVNPMQMQGSFHPKVILLLGEKKAKLFVGSANIKTSGYAINNEVFNYIEYSPEHQEFLDVIVNAIDFFQEINEQSYKLDNSVLSEAKEYYYYHKAAKNEFVTLVHNMESSILGQIKDIITGRVESIDIAVPYYDNELLAFKQLQEIFDGASVTLYIQNKKSTFPIKYNNDNMIARNMVVFDGFLDGSSGSRSNFYHGKVFLFKTKDRAYILYGSSNCTLAALSKIYADGGNIECDLLEVAGIEDFDYFFNNIAAVDEMEFSANTMSFEPEEKQWYSFKYGMIMSSEAELYFSFAQNDTSLEVYYGDCMLKNEILADELIVYIDENILETIPNVFELRFRYKDGEECHRCWTYSKVALESNRLKQSDKKLLDGFDIDSEGDKYIDDRYNLLKAELTCLPEIQEHKKKMAYYNQIKQEQKGDDAESEEYVVEVEIPDEYRIAYKQYNEVARIRNLFFKRFISYGGGLALREEGESPEKIDTESDVAVASKPRKATTYEKKFERFVKTKVRGMLDKSYVEIIEPKHYIGLVAAVFDIFDKYNKTYKVEDIFTNDYVMKTKYDFLVCIISKTIESDDKDSIEAGILKQCYEALACNYECIVNEKDMSKSTEYSSISKQLLKKMEKRYALRSEFEKQVKALKNAGALKQISDINSFIAHIEKLFGYKNYDLLRSYILTVYDDAEIEIKNKIMYITATTNDILNHTKPNTGVLSEISHYVRNVQPVNSVKITVKNGMVDGAKKRGITQIKHSISFVYHHWSSSTTYNDGTVYDTKSVFLSF